MAPHFSELAEFDIDPQAVRLLGYRYCLKRYVVILGSVDDDPLSPVTVGMLEPDNAALIDEVAAFIGRDVQAVGLNSHEIERAVERGFGLDDGEDADRREHRIERVESLRFDPELAAPAIVDDLLGHALFVGASDIHFEAYEEDVDVRFRIDGVMRQIRSPVSGRNLRSVIARLKVLARLDVTERRRAQDGRIPTEVHSDGGKEEIDFRLSVVPGPYGEDAVLRVLDASSALVSLDALGLDESERERFADIVTNPEGLLLVTGPTGSGKTTSLYAAIHLINNPTNKIITVEDPVELQFDKVNQKQVSPWMGFADYARAFMRQNPDVILIGEIRDEETAETAMRAAQTGHLVLATLHTIDSTRAVTRLRSLGVDTDIIGTTLIGSLSQRLARRICEGCRRSAVPDARTRRLLGLDAGRRFDEGGGCGQCGGSGFKGRVGVYELFVPDEPIADMIATDVPIHKVRAEAMNKGMRSLLVDAMEKAEAGLIPVSEVLRIVPYRMIVAAREG